MRLRRLALAGALALALLPAAAGAANPAPEHDPAFEAANAAYWAERRAFEAANEHYWTVTEPRERAAAEAQLATAELGRDLADDALRFVGAPYRWGGETPAGWDCSGFVRFVYARRGVALPRTTWGQADAGRRVGYADLRPGDLVLFYDDLGHVGLYAGGGRVVHALNEGAGTVVGDLASPYWRAAFRFGVRVR